MKVKLVLHLTLINIFQISFNFPKSNVLLSINSEWRKEFKIYY